jgi:hypothetical protein
MHDGTVAAPLLRRVFFAKFVDVTMTDRGDPFDSNSSDDMRSAANAKTRHDHDVPRAAAALSCSCSEQYTTFTCSRIKSNLA